MIDKERLEIGTLKAIGLSNKEILGHYMSITSFILGLACLVGFIIGPLIIPSIMGQKYDILYKNTNIEKTEKTNRAIVAILVLLVILNIIIVIKML